MRINYIGKDVLKVYSDIIRNIQANPQKHNPKDDAQKILDMEKNRQYPVKIIDIAKKMGFTVFTVKNMDDNISGMIGIDAELKEKTGAIKNIVVSEKIKLGKARFVIAHELGHYLYEFDEINEVEYYNTYSSPQNSENREDANEQKANQFAACLLMPEKEFEKEFAKYREKNLALCEIIEKIADKFEVTSKAVKLRFKELDLNAK